MKKIGAEDCYLALLAIYDVTRSGEKIFKKNRDIKRWLASRYLLVNDAKITGIRSARRIFWLLSAANGFIKRENKKMIITEKGYKFLWTTDLFKRYEIFEEVITDISINNPRYRGMPTEIIGDGYRLIKYRGSHMKTKREFTKAGWIFEFLRLRFSENMGSASIAYLHDEQESDWHEHSKTEEIFIFTAGAGYIELGEKKMKIPVNGDWIAIVEAGISHRRIPVYTKNKGRFLNAVVISFPGWESKNEYKIGESVARYDGPVE